jgi:hypothetical protein
MFEGRPTQYSLPGWMAKYSSEESYLKAEEQFSDIKKPRKWRKDIKKAEREVKEGFKYVSAGDPGMARLCYLAAARAVLGLKGPDKDATRETMAVLYEAICAAQEQKATQTVTKTINAPCEPLPDGPGNPSPFKPPRPDFDEDEEDDDEGVPKPGHCGREEAKKAAGA